MVETRRAELAPGFRAGTPVPALPLIGRAVELALLAATLSRSSVRLLTVLGPGGAGKTRLAQALAAAPPARFKTPVSWVDLAHLTDVALIRAVITAARDRAMQAGGGPGAAPAYLLVLDLGVPLPELASMLVPILAETQTLTVLATSRARLRVPGEIVLGLGGLPAPAAVELVLAEVRRARPALIPRADRALLATLSARLDGLPLALIEIARHLPPNGPADLLRRLAHGGPCAVLAPPGQPPPTVWHTLDASYEQLSGTVQHLFRRLAILDGEWSLAAAERICGTDLGIDVPAALTTLCDQSLLGCRVISNNEIYFRMSATTRAYAGARLATSGEAKALQAAHAAYYWAERSPDRAVLDGRASI